MKYPKMMRLFLTVFFVKGPISLILYMPRWLLRHEDGEPRPSESKDGPANRNIAITISLLRIIINAAVYVVLWWCIHGIYLHVIDEGILLDDKTPGESQRHFPGFEVLVPKDVVVEREARIDFDLVNFKFQSSKKIFLSAYVGTGPDQTFFRMSDSLTGSRTRKVVINGCRGTSLEWVPTGDKFSRQVLLRIPKGYGRFNYPFFVHLWYGESSQDDRAIADRVIRTLTRSEFREDEY